MNENINLCEILKDCPKGTKLYSPIAGEVLFKGISYNSSYCPYSIVVLRDKSTLSFTKNGLYSAEFLNGECLLFPSKDQRDWSKWKCPKPKKPKFDPKTLKPFDRVLARYKEDNIWCCQWFSHFGNENSPICMYYVWDEIIPYNDETKHLVGTSDEAPEYYRYWED